ncbi:hypothetical protein [Treponema pectinovorum]|uniref:hypothetical protein n=1 Tax=Treponema pectinovorum TaxID=164 RepID=UPI0011CAFAFC|nr:hypothetical protein [Treponema pectinovorum]
MSLLWLVNCKTTQVNCEGVPLYYPPSPYTKDGKLVIEYNKENDSVTMPFWYWKKVYDYIVDTQAVQEMRVKK